MISVRQYSVVRLLMRCIWRTPIKDSGFPREEFKLKVGAFGAEPWTENMRRDIETKLGIKGL